jgi:DNA-binding NtrC family response regulator
VGSTDERHVDVRVVVATNQDLQTLMQEGRFRLDLYYRISTFPIALPPLRERPADVLPLVDLFLRRTAERLGFDRPCPISTETLRALTAYTWPGNVRELENVIEYATIQADGGMLEPVHLPSHVAGARPCPGATAGVIVTKDGVSFRSAVTTLERELILQSLQLAEGNKARAAELLDLKRTTFLEKLRKLEEEDEPAPVSVAG